MELKAIVISLILVLSLPMCLHGIMELNPIPAEVDLGVLQGNSARTYLDVSNTGTAEHSYSLFQVPETVRTQQLAYYPFDGIYDDLFTCTNGTIVNMPFVKDKDSHVDSAVYFDGYAKYTTRDFAVQNDFSVSFWAKPVSTQNMYSQSYSNAPMYANYLIGPEWGGTSNWGGFGIALGTNGIMLMEHGHGYMPCLLSYSANLSGWHHYTVTFTNHAPKLYLDGTLVRTGISSQRSYTRLSHEIGSYVYGSYSGYLDELCVFNSPLSQAQVNDMYSFDSRSRYIISLQIGTIAAGASQNLMLNMIDTTLPLGSYTDTYILCQGGAAPEYSLIAVETVVTDRGPLAPDAVTIHKLPNGDVQLQWLPVTQDTYGAAYTPTRYRIYRANTPGSMDSYTEIGQSSGTQYVDSFNPLLPAQPMKFYLIRAE